MTAPSSPASGPDAPSRLASVARGTLGGLGFAALMFVTFPPLGWWWLAMLAPVPLLLSIPPEPVLGRGRWIALGVLVGVAPMYGAHFIWVTTASALGFVPLVIYLSVYPALLVLVLHRLARYRLHWAFRVIASATIAVGIDFLRGHLVMDGVAWFLPGQPLIASVALSAPAAYGGFFLVGWLTWLVGAGLAMGVQRRAAGPVVAAMLVVGAWFGGGAAHDATRNGESDSWVDVAVVQTNVPQDIREGWLPPDRVRSWIRLVELTQEAAESLPASVGEDGQIERAGLILWPEGMYPGFTLERDALAAERAQSLVWIVEGEGGRAERIPATLIADEMLLLQDLLDVPIVVSAIGFEGLAFREDDDGVWYEPERQYNSVFVVDRAEPPVDRYDKMHLTPFGEIMPYISAWPALERALLAVGANGMSFNWDIGERPVVLETEVMGRAVRLAAPVCFEATRGDVCRALVFRDAERVAELMVNPTNDIWFDFWDAGRWAHALLSRWRCVELDTPMVRGANSGVSMVIDRRGRVTHAGVNTGANAGRATNADGVLVANVQLGTGVTAYARLGDWPGWIGVLGTLAGAVLAFRTRRGTSGSNSEVPDGAAGEPAPRAGQERSSDA